MKNNHGEVKEAIMLVVKEAAASRPPDIERWEKGHGRLEYRAYWWVEVDELLRTYLADEYGWSDVQWCGLGRRRWQHVYEDQWREEERIFVFSSDLANGLIYIAGNQAGLPTLYPRSA